MNAKLYRSPASIATILVFVLGFLIAIALGVSAAHAAEGSSSLVAGSIAAAETQSGVQIGVQAGVQMKGQSLTADASQSQKAIPISNAKAKKVKKLTYNGKAQTPKIKLTYKKKALVKGKDYLLSYERNINAGTGRAIAMGIGKYTGTKIVTFKIAQAPMKKAKISKIAAQTYTGSAITPAPKVIFGKKSLAKGTDYRVSYSKNVKAGTAKVKVKGIGNFKGTKTVSFKIKKPKSSATKSTKRSVSGNSDIVYITNTGIRYHRGSCEWLYASKIPVTRSEAIAQGYTPCKVCCP